MSASELTPFDTRIPGLPAGIAASHINNGNGLRVHVLQAGHETAGRPVLLLLHGFPELAYSWRKIMLPLAQAGFHVIAPDQRGYGRTLGSDNTYDTDLNPFRLLNFVRDHLGLLRAMGIDRVHAVIGHDYGSPVAAQCALIRPDVFQRVVLMSAPYGGPPSFPDAAGTKTSVSSVSRSIDHEALLAQKPGRVHYQWYYSTREADANMHGCAQGVHDFLRAYYHYKSADWPGNKPKRLKSWAADQLATMPTYYIMNHDEGMAETVAPFMPSESETANCQWLPDDELAVYAGEYQRTGFQGGLQSYRCSTSAEQSAELRLFAGRTIDVPSLFIGGASDWGVYQKPGDFERMQESSCTAMQACHLVDGAGHWVQQEQPEAVLNLLTSFL